MRALLVLALFLCSSVTARAQSLDDAPTVYVASAYDRLVNHGDFQPPDALYTPRLLALWQDMRRDAGDEVGRVDFNTWTNSQDGDLSDLSIASEIIDGREDRMIVTTRFMNLGEAQTIRFYFEKGEAGWRLDDMESAGAEPWTLSLLLKYGSAMKD